MRHVTDVTVNGASLHVTQVGDGPAIVLLHGGLSSHVDWDPVADALAGKYRVIAPDSRGHGRSTNPAGKLSYELLADDVAELIAALGLERPMIGGWSDGGQIAIEVGLRHPGVACGLVVGAASPNFVTGGLRDVHRGLLGAGASGTPDLEYLDAELGEYAEPLKALHPGGDVRWAELIKQTAGMWLGYAGRGADQLASVDTPTLVLAGDRDELVALALSIELHRALPDAELAVIPQLSHDGPSPERAGVIAAVVDDFADRHQSPTTTHQKPRS